MQFVFPVICTGKQRIFIEIEKHAAGDTLPATDPDISNMFAACSINEVGDGIVTGRQFSR